jgi:hypothetical protein
MLPVGSVVAGYRIERVLGAGGMGTVYLAQSPVLPRLEAVKVLSAELSRDGDVRARFVREADVAASLLHPNIVSIYRRGETENGELWIAMQFVDGTDAEDALRAGTMTPERAVFIVGEVAKALDHAHRHNIVHRDVKPANFLLSSEGGVERVLLGDFGIARALDDVGLTVTGSVLATVPYAAPEVLAGMPIDGHADLYSLGCSLFRLITGRTPFGDENGLPAMMMAHLEQPPPRVTDYAPTLSPAWDAVIATAMAKDPAHRFGSAADLAAAAAAALRGQAPSLGAHSGGTWWRPADGPRTMMAAPPTQLGWVPPPVQPKPAKRRRRTWIAAGAAAAVLLVAGTATAVTVAMRSDRTSPAIATSTPEAEPPAAVPVADLEELLLAPREVSAIMGVAMTPEPVRSAMGGDADYLAEKDCAGPWGPGQQLGYAGSGWLAVARQGLSAPGTGQPPMPYQTFQAVVGFPSAELAEGFRAAQSRPWEQCANRQVTFGLPGAPRPIVITFGGMTTTGDGILTTTQTLEGAQGWSCGRALAVRNNVAIDTFACSTANAVDQSVRVLNEIGAKIQG